VNSTCADCWPTTARYDKLEEAYQDAHTPEELFEIIESVSRSSDPRETCATLSRKPRLRPG
jgi:hypothetical protein